jgi:hypothetical protein
MSPAIRDDPPPPRRRITAPPTPRPPSSGRAARLGRDTDAETASAGDVEVIYLRTLVRAQLRLGIVCCLGFAVSITVAAILIATMPGLRETNVAGVPWSWVLQAYGMYPLLALFAALYVHAAGRNEKRYRALGEEG